MNKALLLLVPIALAGCQADNHAHGHADDHGNHSMAHSDAMDMNSAADKATPATLKVSFASTGSFTPNKAQAVTLMLADAKTGAPIGPNELEIAHTKKLHLLIIDESLTDYQHIHPVPGAKPGEWTFNFTPKFARTYRVWSDTKRNGAEQEYVFADLPVGAEKAPAPDAKPLVAGETSDLKFSLSFDGPVKAGEGVMGSVAVVDAKTGKPFAQLQPIMGAFGHVVAFSRDWGSIEHVHPLGDEPTKYNDRSGPVIGFHMEPQNAGVLKIFVQILANGRETIVPFTVNVER